MRLDPILRSVSSAFVTSGERAAEPFVLASASPRRRELLHAAGYEFDVDPADIDETRRDGELPDAFVERLAREKAAEVVRRHTGRVILAADTIVVLSGRVMGKPVDAADAAAMLGALSGRAHDVLTAVAAQKNAAVRARVERTTVWMREIAAGEIEAYIATGEPLDKAGAYAIQGGAGAFVERIDGDLDTVIGLSMVGVRAVMEAIAGLGSHGPPGA
jgi:septum formation protein